MAFNATIDTFDGTAVITMDGDLDASTADVLRDLVERAAGQKPRQLVLEMSRLQYISSAGLRQLVFARQKMDDDVRLVLVGANDQVKQTIRLVGFDHSLTFSDDLPE